MLKVVICCQSGIMDEANFEYISKREVYIILMSDILELYATPKIITEAIAI